MKGSSGPNTAQGNHAICRDFLRNVCTRGSKCRFYHGGADPEGNQGDNNNQQDQMVAPLMPSAPGGCNNNRKNLQDAVVFCHDFQNQSTDCSRPNCRFIHCGREEEVEFRRSGYLPPHVREQIINKGIAPDLPALFGERPICKDFLKGECKWSSCRFRHLSKKQFDLEIGQHITGSHNQSTDYVSFEQSQSLMSSSNTARGSVMWTGGGSPPDHKRRRLDEDMLMGSHEESKAEAGQLRQENLLLRQRVEELKKQVQDLGTTNDFLLDQNAQMRLGVKHHHQQHQIPTTTVVNAMAPTQISVPFVQQPAITMTATMPPPTLTMTTPITMTAQPMPTIALSGAALTAQPSIAISGAAMGPQQSTIAMSGAALGGQPTLAMSGAHLGGQPTLAFSGATIGCQPTIAMSGAPLGGQPTIAMSNATLGGQPTIAMSNGQPTLAMSGPAQLTTSQPQPQTISITGPVVPTQPPPTISLSVESLNPAGLDAACRSGPRTVPPQSANMAGHALATFPPTSCHAPGLAQGLAGAQSTVHVQETTLVTYPITSIRQQQM